MREVKNEEGSWSKGIAGNGRSVVFDALRCSVHAVSRAVAKLNVLAEYCMPFVKKGGYFVAYKAEKIKEEMDEGKKAVKILGGRVDQVISFQLPGTDYNRTLVQVIKEKHTSGKYPRKAGTPAKDPLGT